MWEDVAVLKSILPSANKTKNLPFIVNATKKKVKHSQFQARGQFGHHELHLVFLEKKDEKTSQEFGAAQLLSILSQTGT